MCYLRSFHRDDSVEGPGRVVEEGHVDRGGGGRQPGALRLRVDVEDVGFASENRLLSEMQRGHVFQVSRIRSNASASTGDGGGLAVTGVNIYFHIGLAQVRSLAGQNNTVIS